MSDPRRATTAPADRSPSPRRSRRDAGMTLTEVLVATLVLGLMATSLAMATKTILDQADNTEGRTNNARSEQNVGIYMPADLASAEAVDVEPGTRPCGPDPACPDGLVLSGSNAVTLTWRGQEFDPATNAVVATITRVSYRVVEIDGEFRLVRVACSGAVDDVPACTTRTVLRDLDPPPPDVEWFPGTTRPSWIISVTAAAAPDVIDDAPTTTTGEGTDPGYTNKNAQRVVVTINGGGDAAGAGGGRNQISLSAGGTNRQTNLSTDDLSGAPTFTAARSRCGGNFGVVVDNSGSIGSNMTTVRAGVAELVDAFAGTPVKLQVVAFNTTASTLGATNTQPGRYYDMLVEADVTALKNLVTGIASGGGTNWEDGFFRMLRNPDGSVQSQLPNTILFFTDGIPTFSRLDASFSGAAATPHPADEGLPASNGSDFSQIGWNRAERVLRDRGAIDVIGVYVNSNVDAESQWMVRSGYHMLYERGNTVVFQQGTPQFQRANTLTFQVSLDGDMRYQQRVGGVWQSRTRSQFLTGNTNPTETDDWRSFTVGTISTSSSDWTSITEAQYHAANQGSGTTDGFRTRYSTTATSWINVPQAQYDLSNTTGDSTDGWRLGTTGWANVTETVYLANNTVPGDSDNYRTTTTGSPTSWVSVAKSVYDKSNTTADTTDGWRSRKVYEPPYDFYDSVGSSTIKNFATIGNLVVGNTTGVATGFVEAAPRGGPYTNAAAADLFVLPNYANFASALTSVALGQCGGTVTLQTRVGSQPAQDPFTYENTTTNEQVQTSAAYRSGTFDIALPGGAATTVTISPQQFTNLVRYQPAGWSCRSGGQPYPFSTVPVDGHAPWTAIQLTVEPNRAVSCIQQVVLT